MEKKMFRGKFPGSLIDSLRIVYSRMNLLDRFLRCRLKMRKYTRKKLHIHKQFFHVCILDKKFIMTCVNSIPDTMLLNNGENVIL